MKFRSLILGLSAFGALFVLTGKKNNQVIAQTDYYANVDTSSGAKLVESLSQTIKKGHHDVGYDGLWGAYKTTDVKPGTNIIWDMYSNESFVAGGDKQGHSYSKEGDGYNREHSIPQSWFSKRQPMKSDLFHVYPTDGYVNNRRGSFVYGETSSPTYTSKNGSKVGPSSFEGFNGTVFEPIDEYKGDFARTYFYMATRYCDIVGTWTSGDASRIFKGSYPYLTKYAVDLFTKWNAQDPVSEKELVRNEEVYKIQKNRNPYIDHPEYVAQIYGGTYEEPTVDDAKVNAVIAKINALPATITLDDKSAVSAAQSAYNLLNVAEKKVVTNYSKLQAALAKIAELEGVNNNDDTDDSGEQTVVSGDKVQYSFSGLNSSPYKQDLRFSVNNNSFLCSCGYVDTKLRVGYNSSNKTPLPTKFSSINEANAASMEMEFDIENASGVEFARGTTWQADRWYIMFSSDKGKTWTKVANGDATDASYSASLATPTTGRFAFIICAQTGSPRVEILNMDLYSDPNAASSVSLKNATLASSLNVKYEYTNDELTNVNVNLNAIGHIAQAEFNADAKYFALCVKASDVEAIGTLYTSGSVLDFARANHIDAKEISADSIKNNNYTAKAAFDVELTEDYVICIAAELDGKVTFTYEATYKVVDMVNYYLTNFMITDQKQIEILNSIINN